MSAEIIKFEPREPEPEGVFVWACGACGSTVYELHANGDIVCDTCGALMGDLKVSEHDPTAG